MTFEKLVNENHKELTLVAYRITGNKTKANDLISETYLNLHNKQVPLIKNEFVKFFSKSMGNLNRWSRSSFNKFNNGKEILKEVEVATEEEVCKYCLFNEIELFKDTLPPHEKKLFELYYEMQISTRKIASELTTEFKIKVSSSSIDRLLLPVKIKVKEKKWKVQFTD